MQLIHTDSVGIRAVWWLLAGALLAGTAGCSSRLGAGTTTADSTIRFRDVTNEAGISWTRVNGAFGKKWRPETMGGGGAFLDYDNDGRLDILLVNGDTWPSHTPPGAKRPIPALYRNNGNGS